MIRRYIGLVFVLITFAVLKIEAMDLRKLPPSFEGEYNEKTDCAVCFKFIPDDQEKIALPCKGCHVIHKECFFKNLCANGQPECPRDQTIIDDESLEAICELYKSPTARRATNGQSDNRQYSSSPGSELTVSRPDSNLTRSFLSRFSAQQILAISGMLRSFPTIINRHPLAAIRKSKDRKKLTFLTSVTLGLALSSVAIYFLGGQVNKS